MQFRSNRKPRILYAQSIRNAGHCIDRWLNSVETLDYPKDKIGLIFIDQFSSDDSSNRLSEWLDEHKGEYRFSKTVFFNPKTTSQYWEDGIKDKNRYNQIAHAWNSIKVTNKIVAPITKDFDYIFDSHADIILPQNILNKFVSTFERFTEASYVAGLVHHRKSFTKHNHYPVVYVLAKLSEPKLSLHFSLPIHIDGFNCEKEFPELFEYVFPFKIPFHWGVRQHNDFVDCPRWLTHHIGIGARMMASKLYRKYPLTYYPNENVFSYVSQTLRDGYYPVLDTTVKPKHIDRDGVTVT